MSGGRIYLLNQENTLIAMTEQPYDSESLLQQLLATHADLLAGEQINRDVPRRWLLVTREMSVPDELDGPGRWSLDHLFLDQDGVPTLVEVKRSCDSRIRREVVGQMLDYAANAVAYWPVDDIRSRFVSRCAQERADPVESLDSFLNGVMDEESFWKRVSENLRKGRIRMVFVADDIPSELQRIVEFLNQQFVEAEVFAVEVRQFVGGGVTTLVPRVVGQTLKPHSSDAKAGRQWDKISFFEALQERSGDQAVHAARRLLDWAESQNLNIFWGRGYQMGSFIVSRLSPLGQHFMFGVWTYGKFDIPFQWMSSVQPFTDDDKRRELAKQLEPIVGVTIPDELLSKRPPYPLSTLTPDNLDAFLRVFEWMDSQIDAKVSEVDTPTADAN